MKMECEVIEAKTNGESLTIELQGTTVHAAKWRNLERQTLIVPDTEGSRKTFYLGRRCVLSVKAL